MKKNKKNILLDISKRKKLSFLDTVIIYRLLYNTYDDTTFVRLFLDNYFGINGMPVEFYKLFLYCLHSNRYRILLDILAKKNIYELIDLLKDNNISYSDIDIDPIVYFNISKRYINSIVLGIKKLEVCNKELPLKKIIANNAEWNLRRTYNNSDENINMIAIKMYLTIGLDNAIDLLNGKYGLLDYELLYYLFNRIIINNKDSKSISAFQEFLFANKKDSNNIVRMMLNGEFIELFINFDYFYNSIDYFIEKLGYKFNKTKISLLLKERYLAPRIDSPELSGDILQDMISSYYHKYGIDDKESEVIDKNMEAYNDKLKKKTKSSIMKVDIPKFGDYTFEMIPLKDVRNLVIGYRAGNCFRINGDAFILFNNFLTNPHMRILSISIDEYKDFGMVLLMRNGNVLIAQGIETSKRVPNQILGEKLYTATKKAIETIIEKMNNEGDEIVASIIGLSNNNTILYNHNILPFIVNPLLDNNHQYYNGIDNYQGLLSLSSNKTLNDIKLFTPEKLYSDKDRIIYRSNSKDRNSINYREIEKILISLRYAKFKNTSEEEMIYYYSDIADKTEDYTICTYDWFIIVFEDGSIDTFINSEDEEVINEYNQYLDEVRQLKVVRKRQ